MHSGSSSATNNPIFSATAAQAVIDHPTQFRMKFPNVKMHNARLIAIILVCAGVCAPLFAGHVIRGRLANAPGDVAYLAMMYGGRQYMVDTAQVVNGEFI